MNNKSKAWLLLQDGTLLEGENFGASGETIGELVFSTAMTGYQEALTDPCYYGQILLQTFPMLGNSGINSEDFISDHCYLRACIVREWCPAPSNFRCEENIDSFLKKQNVIGLCSIDTRHLTTLLREKGTMAAMVTTEEIKDIPAALKKLADFRLTNAVEAVTADQALPHVGGTGRNIAVMNLGYTGSIVSELASRGCSVTCLSASEDAERYAAFDGVVLSEGPGDPAECVKAAETVKALCEKKVPLLGIGLGHQILALANGAETEKLSYGHRGANQPVLDLASLKTYPTSQNHSYVVTNLPESAGKISHRNVNDKSCAGIRYTSVPALSVQFRPAGPGKGQDTGYVFDEFLRLTD